MDHLLLSSNDCSPFTSPFSSAHSSPSTSLHTSPNRSRQNSPTRLSGRSDRKSSKLNKSPKISPFGSPKILLKRANSYRQKGKKGKSHIDDVIEKQKQMPRSRSHSTPDIKLEIDISKLSLPLSDESDVEKSSSENHEHSDEGKHWYKEHKNILRKKSLTALFELTKNIKQVPKLKRSESQRFSRAHKVKEGCDKKKQCVHEAAYNGPLFQATTIFVPGYDFKTKQATPLTTSRRQSTPLFPRRGSKEKFHVAPEASSTTEKHSSTPNLTRKSSKEKMKQFEIKQDLDSKFQRSESLPVDRIDHVDDTNVLTINQRKTVLAHRLKKFEEFKKNENLNTLEVPSDSLQGLVHQVASRFEHGTHFWRRYKQTKKREERMRKHRSCEIEHDSIYRQRAESFESGRAFWKQNSLSDAGNDSVSSQGSESGYASPSDNNEQQTTIPLKNSLYTPHVFIRPKIILSDFSHSWSNEQWQMKPKSKGLISPDIARVISTDLCTTEL